MFTVNMKGSDKQPPLVIGKVAQPSALKKKNVLLKNLKIEHYNNIRAWMNGPIFHSYMKNWNDELARRRRHILLLIDNAPSHIVDEYSNIKIQFLPPNGNAAMPHSGSITEYIFTLQQYCVGNKGHKFEEIESATKIVRGKEGVRYTQQVN